MNITTGIFGFLLVCCAYAARYWAYKSRQELKKINEKLDRLLEAPLRQT